MNLMKMCLNWAVLVGLAAIGLSIYLFAPQFAAAALPSLLLALCPLSMLFMMAAMNNNPDSGSQTDSATDSHDVPPSRKEQLGRLKAEHTALASRIAAMVNEETTYNPVPARSYGVTEAG